MTLPLKPFKVVCEVSVDGKLTKGKAYKVLVVHGDRYAVGCDNGAILVFPKEYFREVR